MVDCNVCYCEFRKTVVQQARSWIGTKYQHQGRLKKANHHEGGCDCIGLLIGVFQELKITNKKGELFSSFDKRNYSRTPNGKDLIYILDQHLMKKDIEMMLPGDILLMKFKENPQHMGIVADYPVHQAFSPNSDEKNKIDKKKYNIIHSYLNIGKVVEHILDKKWMNRVVVCYKLPFS